MDISRKTDCALRMLAMLMEREDAMLSVRVAADEVGVPYSFMRSIQYRLVQAGVIESVRGVHGGMRLKVDPADVTLREVVEAVRGSDDEDDFALLETSCYHALWTGVRALVASYLDSVTLDDVVRRSKNPAVDPMFTSRERFLDYAGVGADSAVETA